MKITNLKIALICLLVTACGTGWPNALYVPSSYKGTWEVRFQSDQCGDYTGEVYTYTGGMIFRGYGDKYSIDFRRGIKGRIAKGEAQETVIVENLSTGETTELEAPAFQIRFSSSDRGEGIWQARDCKGTIELEKISE